MDKWCSNCDRGHFDTQILLQNYWNREHFEPLHLICAGMFIAMRISAAKGAFPLSTSGKDKEADHVAKQSLRRLWVAPHHQRLRKEMHSHIPFRTESCDRAMSQAAQRIRTLVAVNGVRMVRARLDGSGM